MRKGWVLAVIAVVALVAGAVTVTTLGSGGDGARPEEAAGRGTADPRALDAPEASTEQGSTPDPIDTDVAHIKQAASDAHLSTVLYRVAQMGDRRLSPERSAQITDLPAEGPGSLTLLDGRVVVEADVDDAGPGIITTIEAAGGQILNVNSTYRVVTTSIAPTDLFAVGQVPGVRVLREVLGPLVNGVPTNRAHGGVGAQSCTGSITTEGDQQLNADDARNQFGVDGSGVKVGILSDSFSNTTSPTSETTDIASGDLPGPANPCGHPVAVQNIKPGCDTAAFGVCRDEGRALAQIVHDLAPGAEMAFSNAGFGEFAFESEIERLWSSSPSPPLPSGQQPVQADIIADDITYFVEPMFQDGPVANAVSEAVDVGVTYLSSAGNSNVIANGGKDLGSYETPSFRPIDCPPLSALTASEITGCHDFNPGPGEDPDLTFKLRAGESFLLNVQWSEPRHGVTSDIDVQLYEGNTQRATSEQVNPGALGQPGVTQLPFEFIAYTNTSASDKTLRLIIDQWGTSNTPRFKGIFSSDYHDSLYAFEYDSTSSSDLFGPTIFGHNGSAKALSTAAIEHSNSSDAEPYSSRGPVRHYWGPVSPSGVPASGTAETQVDTPDFTATDGGANTFFGQVVNSVHRFYGTSAAVAHAAGVAALLQEADPFAAPADVRTALEATAVPVGVPAKPPEVVGAGLLDAHAAVESRLAHVTIQVDADPNDAQDFEFSSDSPRIPPFTLDDDGDPTNESSVELTLLPGVYTVTESDPTGWALIGLTCNTGEDPTPATKSVTVTLTAAEDVTCTFANQKRGSITIVEDTSPTEHEQVFEYSGDLGVFELDDDGEESNTTSSMTFNDLAPGDYTVAQTQVDGFVLDALSCAVDTESPNVPAESVAISLGSGESVTCTFTNRQVASLTIVEESLPDDAESFSYAATGLPESTFDLDDAPGAPMGDQAKYFADVEPGAVSVTQAAENAFTLHDIECDGGTSDPDLDLETVALDLIAGEHVTCTFENVRNAAPGEIVIVENSVPDAPGAFTYTVPAELGANPTLDDDPASAATLDYVVLDPSGPPGEYVITQQAVPGFEFRDVTCTDGGEPGAGGAPSATVTTPTGPDGVTCIFTNDKLASITVVQDTEPDGPQPFHYSLAGEPEPPVDNSFDLDDDPTTTLVSNSDTTWDLQDGNYTLSQTQIQGWDLTDIDCSDDSVGDLETGTVEIALPESTDVTCTFKSTERGSITVVEDNVPNLSKPWGFTMTGESGFTLDDGQSHAGMNLPSGDYTILRSGTAAGWSFVSVACSPDAGTTVTNGVTVHVDPGEDVTCTFVHTTRRPDARISTSSTMSSAAGDNLYGTTGSNQKKSKTVLRQSTGSFYVKFQNEGALPGNFTLKGSSGNSKFSVRYYWGSTEVTAQVKAGTYTRANVAPGADVGALRIAVRPASTATKGSSYSTLLTVTSPDGSKDAVKAITYAG